MALVNHNHGSTPRQFTSSLFLSEKSNIFVVGTKPSLMKTIGLLVATLFIANIGLAQDTWTAKANFGGVARGGCFGFSIGTKGYIGAGVNGSGNLSDMWEWNQGTNTWTQKVSLNTARRAPMSFVINGIGYCCMGFASSQISDLWAYDPSLNTWSQKANFQGAARYGAAGFSIGNKGYIGLGASAGGNGPYSTDFWEYDPGTNSWTQKASPVLVSRYGLIGFSIGTKGYIGMGYDGSTTTFFHDLYQYDQTTNSWVQKATLPGQAGGSYPAAFAMAGKGYVCAGNSNGVQSEFWEYEPTLNTWTQRANYGGGAVCIPAAFSIGGKGYVGTGFDLNTYNNTFWEYSPINVGINEEKNEENLCSVYPSIISEYGNLEIKTSKGLANTVLSIFDMNGKLVRNIPVNEKHSTFERGDLKQGAYLYDVISNDKKIGSGKFIIE